LTAIHYNTLQRTATNCNTLQHSATHFWICTGMTTTHCNTMQHTAPYCNILQHTATHCNTLQYTATLCNERQHIATHCNKLRWDDCNTLQCIAAQMHCSVYCNALQHTATHCNALQRTATHCNALQRTTAHCKLTAAYGNTLQTYCHSLHYTIHIYVPCALLGTDADTNTVFTLAPHLLTPNSLLFSLGRWFQRSNLHTNRREHTQDSFHVSQPGTKGGDHPTCSSRS